MPEQDLHLHLIYSERQSSTSYSNSIRSALRQLSTGSVATGAL
jgi:hypothetical protein